MKQLVRLNLLSVICKVMVVNIFSLCMLDTFSIHYKDKPGFTDVLFCFDCIAAVPKL